MRENKLNPKIFESSLELDLSIYKNLSVLFLNQIIEEPNGLNQKTIIEQTTQFTEQFNEKEQGSDVHYSQENKIKKCLELFQQVDLERKFFRSLVQQFIKQKYWQIQMSVEDELFLRSKLNGVNSEIQQKKIEILEKEIKRQKTKLKIEREKMDQINQQNMELKEELKKQRNDFKKLISNDEPSFFLDQIKKLETEKAINSSTKKFSSKGFTQRSSKQLIGTFNNDQKNSLISKKSRSIKRQGSLLSGLKKGLKKDFKFSGQFMRATQMDVPNEYESFKEHPEKKRLTSRFNFTQRNSYKI